MDSKLMKVLRVANRIALDVVASIALLIGIYWLGRGLGTIIVAAIVALGGIP